LCDQVGRRDSLDESQSVERSRIVGALRETLARVCIEALQPDLVILDEFQRFKDLLQGDDFAAGLARALFNYTNEAGSERARVLLLSATPYKMFTASDEASGDDHYKDFIDTVRFLQDDATKTSAFESELKNYRKQAFRYDAQSLSDLRAARVAVESTLKNVMTRTERLAVRANRDGMLQDVPPGALTLMAGDLQHYLSLQRVARLVGHGDTADFWKSASYVLHFMEDYQLKHQLKKVTEQGSEALYEQLTAASATRLSREDLAAYRRIDPANARLRSLLHHTTDRGAARALWIPPAAPYYRLEGPFAALQGFTKRLVFSAWQVVPKVVASLVSFEAERQLLHMPEEGVADANTATARARRRGLLRYGLSDGRLTGMPVLALVYPSPTLAILGDPLRAAALVNAAAPGNATLKEVLTLVQKDISVALAQLEIPSGTEGAEDQRWYWAAPILLDRAKYGEAAKAWFQQPSHPGLWQGEIPTESDMADENEGRAEDRWADHVQEAARLVEEGLAEPLGRVPADLPEVLARLAVGGLANNALRALGRVAGGDEAAILASVRNAAGTIAEGLRSLFNRPEVVTSILQTDGDERYWQMVLDYCARGGLPAVLDEYAHVAFEADSLAGKPLADVVSTIATRMVSALTLQTATLRADLFTLDQARRKASLHETFGFRTAFAVRYGARGDEGQAADRNQRLQVAFNSPFWPFVLCTTSVGQEGLDFHSYCHAVVHWNLPSNPVDLEQREGRVHRFKGHAVRRNVASRHMRAAFRREDADPWISMFREARTAAEGDDSDLVPYWVYSVENGAQIERYVPALPLSRDAGHYERLKRSLTLYRMAFGQSRQEDLIAFLQQNVPAEARAQAAAEMTIDLTPPRSMRRLESNMDDVDLSASELAHSVKDGRAYEPDEASTITLQQARTLLDGFVQRRIDISTDSRARAGGGARRIGFEELGRLLDDFADARPAVPCAGPGAQQFTELLDDYRFAVERTR
jgi:hypothetical protein